MPQMLHTGFGSTTTMQRKRRPGLSTADCVQATSEPPSCPATVYVPCHVHAFQERVRAIRCSEAVPTPSSTKLKSLVQFSAACSRNLPATLLDKSDIYYVVSRFMDDFGECPSIGGLWLARGNPLASTPSTVGRQNQPPTARAPDTYTHITKCDFINCHDRLLLLFDCLSQNFPGIFYESYDDRSGTQTPSRP